MTDCITTAWTVHAVQANPGRHNGAHVPVVDGYAYVLGGSTTAEGLIARRYHFDTDTWDTVTAPPAARITTAGTGAKGLSATVAMKG